MKILSRASRMSLIAIGMSGVLLPSLANAENIAGYQSYEVQAPHHGGDVQGAIYYPANEGGMAHNTGENAVFYGTPVMKDAPITEGEYPLVLLSHGLGGNIRSMGWLAAGLAQKGAIVVTVNHPNSSTFSFDMQVGLNHWTRAQDFSLVLDDILADAQFVSMIDQSNIVASGFSYGGWTALSLGGLTGDHTGYIEHCEDVTELSSHCADINRMGGDLAKIDADDWDRSYKDARVTKVVAVDPALHYGLDADNISELVPDVMMIALGEGEDRLLATNYDESGSNFRQYLPDAEYRQIAPAYHFSFLPVCKPEGEKILKLENDDPVCSDPEGADRAKLHKAVISDMADFIGL